METNPEPAIIKSKSKKKSTGDKKRTGTAPTVSKEIIGTAHGFTSIGGGDKKKTGTAPTVFKEIIDKAHGFTSLGQGCS